MSAQEHLANCNVTLFNGRLGAICTCGSVPLRVEVPTEMTSLKEIKAKLDVLLNYQEPPFDERHRVLVEKLNAILKEQQQECQRQDNTAVHVCKLLDAIKEQLRTLDAGLHETAMRNHQQLRSDIAGLADAPLDRPGVRKRPKPRGKAR